MATKVRMQPMDLEVCPDNPFQYDLLDRKEPVTILTNIISSIEGPCVLAIDAPWGAGKSTFIKMWTAHLHNEGFHVVNFSAWETDFSEDPFIALSEEISQELEQHKSESDELSSAIEKVGRATREVVIRAIPGLIRMGTGGVLDVNPIVEELRNAAIDQLEEGSSKDRMSSYRSMLVDRFQGDWGQEISKDKMSGYREARKSVRDFRNALQEMADALAESNNGLPLVVIIDELDRCRPTYAARLLEVAKHLFAVNNIVFVLAVNRSELVHSIRALYGNEFDAMGYLRRFFDIDFSLPEPNRRTFIETNLVTTGVESFFKSTEHLNSRDFYPKVKEMLLSFFDAYEISLRTILQALHRLGLTLASLPPSQQPLARELVVALIVRTVDIVIYRKFIRSEITDAEVADDVFSLPGLADIRMKSEGILFESILIVGMMHMTADSDGLSAVQLSPLLEQYKAIIAEAGEADTQDPNFARASEIVKGVDALSPTVMESRLSRFRDAVQRLELVSRDLIADEL